MFKRLCSCVLSNSNDNAPRDFKVEKSKFSASLQPSSNHLGFSIFNNPKDLKNTLVKSARVYSNAQNSHRHNELNKVRIPFMEIRKIQPNESVV